MITFGTWATRKETKKKKKVWVTICSLTLYSSRKKSTQSIKRKFTRVWQVAFSLATASRKWRLIQAWSRWCWGVIVSEPSQLTSLLSWTACLMLHQWQKVYVALYPLRWSSLNKRNRYQVWLMEPLETLQCLNHQENLPGKMRCSFPLKKTEDKIH